MRSDTTDLAGALEYEISLLIASEPVLPSGVHKLQIKNFKNKKIYKKIKVISCLISQGKQVNVSYWYRLKKIHVMYPD